MIQRFDRSTESPRGNVGGFFYACLTESTFSNLSRAIHRFLMFLENNLLIELTLCNFARCLLETSGDSRDDKRPQVPWIYAD